jgi:ribosomal protein L21E
MTVPFEKGDRVKINPVRPEAVMKKRRHYEHGTVCKVTGPYYQNEYIITVKWDNRKETQQINSNFILKVQNETVD